MNRFNQQRINVVEGESRKPRTNKKCSGFAQIELLVAISTAILIGLLIPADGRSAGAAIVQNLKCISK